MVELGRRLVVKRELYPRNSGQESIFSLQSCELVSVISQLSSSYGYFKLQEIRVPTVSNIRLVLLKLEHFSTIIMAQQVTCRSNRVDRLFYPTCSYSCSLKSISDKSQLYGHMFPVRC